MSTFGASGAGRAPLSWRSSGHPRLRIWRCWPRCGTAWRTSSRGPDPHSLCRAASPREAVAATAQSEPSGSIALSAGWPAPRETRSHRMSTDAIVMLKDDHKLIRRAFRDFEDAGDAAHQAKGELVAKIIELLTVHTYIENEVMYPRVRELVPELEDDVLESYEEHHVADLLVMDLTGIDPENERFTAKTMVLIENVRHHIEEEENEWFPQVREALGRKVLQDLGAQMAQAR